MAGEEERILYSKTWRNTYPLDKSLRQSAVAKGAEHAESIIERKGISEKQYEVIKLMIMKFSMMLKFRKQEEGVWQPELAKMIAKEAFPATVYSTTSDGIDMGHARRFIQEERNWRENPRARVGTGRPP